MSIFIYKLLEKRGIFFYGTFLFYLLTIHPRLLERLSQHSRQNPDPFLGWLFLLLPLFELIGLWLKYPLLSYYAREYPEKSTNTKILALVFLPILHLAMAAFLFIIGTQIAGLQPAGNAAWHWQLLYVFGFFLMLFKEMAFLALFLSFGGIPWTKKESDPPLKRLRKKLTGINIQNLLEDALGDIFLLVFSTAGYTALWEYIGLTSPLDHYAGFWQSFWELLGLFLYFLMVIPPLQAIYLLQDTLTRETKTQKIWAWAQYLLLMLTAFAAML